MPPQGKVKYDFAAADELSRALKQLVNKIHWLIWVRDTRSSKYFDCGEQSWCGKNHDQFVRDLQAQRRVLNALAQEAASLKRQVDDATAAATAKLSANHH
ncbi:hypothetical protein [Streptomyces misionensis]|uniref:hypothetical protein n=1 Tax=Streptomyces misionensis TaxID=67331 RepID=UPI0036B0F8BA